MLDTCLSILVSFIKERRKLRMSNNIWVITNYSRELKQQMIEKKESEKEKPKLQNQQTECNLIPSADISFKGFSHLV